MADLEYTYSRSTSMICTILKNKDKIKEIDASKSDKNIYAMVMYSQLKGCFSYG